MEKYEQQAVRRLARNQIHAVGKILYLPPVGPGLKLWTAIDFLMKRYRYMYTRLPHPVRKKKEK